MPEWFIHWHWDYGYVTSIILTTIVSYIAGRYDGK